MNTNEACRILGINGPTSKSLLKAAYRAKCKKYHPDVYKGADALKRMTEINEAFELLEKHGVGTQQVRQQRRPMTQDEAAREFMRRANAEFMRRENAANAFNTTTTATASGGA